MVRLQNELQILMVLVFGEPEDKAGQLSLNPYFSRLVLVIKLNFSIIYGVGVVLF